MYAVGQNEAPRLPARVRVNGAPADAVLWLDAVRAARPLPSPSSAPTVAEGAAGNLTGAYRWLVAFGSAVMVSYPSPVSALLTVTAKRVNLSVVPTSTDGRVTKRRIYRTLAGGSVYKLVGEIADNVTTDFEDNVADGALTDEYLAVTVFADGNATDEWAERGRYGNHATQGTAGNRPLFKVGILNGRPVVRFDGTSDYLVAPLAVIQPEAFFIVGQWRSVYDAATMLDGNFVNSRRLFAHSGTPVYRIVATDNDFVTATTVTTGTFQIIYALFNGASSELRINGGPADVGNWGSGSGDGSLVLGALGDPGSVPAAIDVATIIAYNRVPPDAERKRAERYFSRKYAITVA